MMKEMKQKDFRMLCQSSKAILRFFQVMLIAFAVTNPLRFLGIVGVERPDLHTAILDQLYLISLGVAAGFGAGAFRSMEKAETPFLYDVSDKIKGASFVLLGGGIVVSVYKLVLDLCGVLPFKDGPDMIPVLIMGMLLLTLVYVIEQGCRLQKESDETL